MVLARLEAYPEVELHCALVKWMRKSSAFEGTQDNPAFSTFIAKRDCLAAQVMDDRGEERSKWIKVVEG